MNMVQGTSIINDEDVQLPGFRFHPTDEELVGFYLRRKVDNKSLPIEHLIKHIDIYKYDPWDLPKANTVGDENESYFFCRRGKKYRNSVRPNRVTGSGFWKATGIDKAVYSVGGEAKVSNYVMESQEVWTICRIFKRYVDCRKNTPNWGRVAAKRSSTGNGNGIHSSQSCSVESSSRENYITFGSLIVQNHEVDKAAVMNNGSWHGEQSMASLPSSCFSNYPENDFFTNADWEQLKSVVELALDPFLM
ncbi:Detected protein of unknown function [Hibiscus syriacus]|uniref:NAC domain-containing protein n=1 Tax=Hibiscus syriacus TaxID=106335 RepID=A0A6A2Z7K1_HIBSY|nr:Detected protein of unknown function [Hibiscus syriacus]